jgi:hypothetical protein
MTYLSILELKIRKTRKNDIKFNKFDRNEGYLWMIVRTSGILTVGKVFTGFD